jgi:hypothetical protein
MNAPPEKSHLFKLPFNLGFNNRMFLTKAEWNIFRKRKPVRYIRGRKHDFKCSICGLKSTPNNPLQHAHRIGFEMGGHLPWIDS